MVIYIDELFIKNFIMTYLITIITGEILNKSSKNFKLILASFLSTILTIILIIYDLEFNFVSRLITISLLVFIAFNPRNMEVFVMELVTTLIITFLIGGIVKSSIENICEIIICGATVFLGLKKYNDYLKKKKWKIRNSYKIDFQIDSKSISINAFLDTGNFLSSNALNEPVIVISESIARDKFPKEIFNLLKSGELKNLKFSLIKNIRPIYYSTIDTQDKMLYGIKVKKIKIKYENKTIIRDAVIILAKEKIRDFDALIGITLLEGGFEDGNAINLKAESEEIVC